MALQVPSGGATPIALPISVLLSELDDSTGTKSAVPSEVKFDDDTQDHHWFLDQWDAESNRLLLRVLNTAGNVVGAAFARRVDVNIWHADSVARPTVHVNYLYVLKAYRRCGVAKSLMKGLPCKCASATPLTSALPLFDSLSAQYAEWSNDSVAQVETLQPATRTGHNVACWAV